MSAFTLVLLCPS